MSYSLARFLRPLRETDKIIRIFDDRNSPIHSINPFSILRLFVTNSNLNISLSGNRTISLDFTTHAETKEAIAKLQTQIDILRRKAPQVIDKATENFIEQAIEIAQSGLSTLNGLTQSSQNLVVAGGENLDFRLTSVGNTHSLSLALTGLIPTNRGGLGNGTFSSQQLLIYQGESQQVVSSGFSIGGAENEDRTLWSAREIKDYISGLFSGLETQVSKEVPAGVVDGENKTFSLLRTPIENSEHLYLNGLLLESGLGNDYVIVNGIITFNQPPHKSPNHSDKILCSYRHIP